MEFSFLIHAKSTVLIGWDETRIWSVRRLGRRFDSRKMSIKFRNIEILRRTWWRWWGMRNLGLNCEENLIWNWFFFILTQLEMLDISGKMLPDSFSTQCRSGERGLNFAEHWTQFFFSFKINKLVKNFALFSLSHCARIRESSASINMQMKSNDK